MSKKALIESKAILKLYIAPAFAGNVKEGIVDKLDRLLLKYSHDAQGVIVAYYDVRTLEKTARIMNDCPFMHLHVSTRLVSFSPEVGMMLEGKVVKQNSDHMGLLIYNVFNAFVPARMVDGYRWSDENDAWTADDGTALNIDDKVSVAVAKIIVENDIMSLMCSLKPLSAKRKRATTE